MKIAEGSIAIEETVIGEDGVPCRQIRHVDLSSFQEEKEDVDPATLKESLGLPSNARANQLGLKILKRIKGL